MSGAHCSRTAPGDPLAGTAPVESSWLFVEAPGAWGAKAATSSSLHPSQQAELRRLGPQWRVVLVRRADRPLRSQRDRMVWLSSPGRVGHWRLPAAAPVTPELLGEPGEPVSEVLFICTNGSRDRCCAAFGRPLLELLPELWECSHLGGHRFAPTGVRLSDRMVFGRLHAAAAASVLAGATPLDNVRGPAGWPAPVQVAAVAVWRVHGTVPVEVASGQDVVDLTLSDGSRWRVPVATNRIEARPVSCGGPAEDGAAPFAGSPVRL